MEMHQIRYFLAVARELNFTRAAEACNVSQPSLTRAIKTLEAELGGEMFLRERANTHLTELGRTMLPFLASSYESALAAKQKAEQLQTGQAASLRLAMTGAVDFDIVSEALAEVGRSFRTINLTCMRMSDTEVLDALRSGDIELAVAGPLDNSWDRLDSWLLFDEPLGVVMRRDYDLADRPFLDIGDLGAHRLILRPYCQKWASCAAMLEAKGVDLSVGHEVSGDRDAFRFLEAGLGIAIMPLSTRIGEGLCKVPVIPQIRREIRLYSVAGRARSRALTGLINLLRASNWTRFRADGPQA